MYDKNAGINRKTMEQYDPYEERARLGVDGEVSDKTVRPMLPMEMLNFPEWIFTMHKLLLRRTGLHAWLGCLEESCQGQDRFRR